MPKFLVTWVIDIDADTHEGAARQALEIQRDPNSLATVFTTSKKVGGPVRDIRIIDLTDLDTPTNEVTVRP